MIPLVIALLHYLIPLVSMDLLWRSTILRYFSPKSLRPLVCVSADQAKDNDNSASDTSVAAPHVAGAAALIKSPSKC